MPSILLDEGVPAGIRRYLTGFTVITTVEQGWAGLENGKLIAAAEAAGFGIVITSDQNWKHQQNLSTRQIALIVIETTNWVVIRRTMERIVAAVESAQPGSYTSVPFDRPPLRRRPFKGAGP